VGGIKLGQNILSGRMEVRKNIGRVRDRGSPEEIRKDGGEEE
jgi:hypothetical protein